MLVMFALVFFVLPNISLAGLINRVPNNLGLVGYWSFDDGVGTRAGDSSGNVRNGTLTNMENADWVNGKRGKALDFDGADEYVSVGNVFNGVRAVAFWIKTDNLSKKILDLNGTATVEVVAGTITANSFTSPTIYVDGSVSSTIDTNWHHVVITTGTNINASAVDIGRISTGYLDGALDEVRLYSRALSSNNVSNLYQSGFVRLNSSRNGEITSGLIGLWSFDGPDLISTTAHDRSSSAINGTLTNFANPATSKLLGAIGQALKLDGTDDYISIPSSSNWNFGSADFAVSWWENRTNNASSTAAILRDGTALIPPYAFGLSNAGANLGVYISSAAASGWDIANNQSLGAVTQNVWNHFTVTRNGSTFTAYKNGAQTDTWTSSGTIATNSNALSLGFHSGGGASTYFAGSLDDVRIYNRNLSGSEVKRLYNFGVGNTYQSSPVARVTGGLLAHWTFDGKDISFISNTATDRSGQGRTASFSGMSTTSSRVSGVIGQAISFATSSDFMTFNDTGLPAVAESRSVSVWMKNTADNTGDDYFVAWGAEGGNTNFGFGLINVNKLLITNGGVSVISDTTLGVDGQWHHVLVTADGTDASLYIDGALDITGSLPLNTSLDGIGNIGTHFDNAYTQDTSARLDEVRIYNRVLSATEIIRLYNLGR